MTHNWMHRYNDRIPYKRFGDHLLNVSADAQPQALDYSDVWQQNGEQAHVLFHSSPPSPRKRKKHDHFCAKSDGSTQNQNSVTPFRAHPNILSPSPKGQTTTTSSSSLSLSQSAPHSHKREAGVPPFRAHSHTQPTNNKPKTTNKTNTHSSKI